MTEFNKPEDMEDPLMGVFWEMLIEIESNTNHENPLHMFNRQLVERAYEELRKRGLITYQKPRWLQNEQVSED